jgi:hypothetical protein
LPSSPSWLSPLVASTTLAETPWVLSLPFHQPNPFVLTFRPQWRMEGSRMITECKKINGQYLRSRHDLNLCIANSFGALKPANL